MNRSSSPGPSRGSPVAVRRLLAAGAVGALLLGAAACGSGGGAGSGRPLVVATTTQLADFARVIGGDAVEVRSLMRPNVDAHDFDPSPADLDALARADVIVANGVGLEPWLDDAVEAAGASAEVTDASEGVVLLDGTEDGHDHGAEEDLRDEGDDGDEGDHRDGDDHGSGDAADPEPSSADGGHEAGDGHDHGGVDPHVWLDPENARVMAANVADALAAAVPDRADAIGERAAAYDAELVALDEEIRGLLGDLDDPRIVTDHDAFGYFAEHYGIEVVGSILASSDASAEVSAGDLRDLARRIEEAGVGAVFTEQSMPPDAAEALARMVDVDVVSGEDGLYTDSLGPEGSTGDTYLGMMRHNATTLARHLQ